MRYVGQSYELDVAVSLTAGSADAIEDAFQTLHEEIYGYANRGLPVEVVGLRLTHRRPGVAPFSSGGEGGSGRPFAERPAYFPGLADPVVTPIYWRDDLASGQVVRGPAVVEQEDATTVVYPRQSARRLTRGALLIEREEDR